MAIHRVGVLIVVAIIEEWKIPTCLRKQISLSLTWTQTWKGGFLR